jgi:hypothetical protein
MAPEMSAMPKLGSVVDAWLPSFVHHWLVV